MKKPAAVLAGIGAVIVFLAGFIFGNFFKKKTVIADRKEKYEEVKSEIQSTPASELIADAHNADELRANIGSIAGQAKHQFRDRVRAILSRDGGSGTAEGSRDGD